MHRFYRDPTNGTWLLFSYKEAKLSLKPFYFSVDLEDFTYNLLRVLGHETETNFNALDLSYEVIRSFSKQKLDNKKITFFTTGILAKEYPELVQRIHSDGHEIACHYHFHDLMFLEDNSTIENNLVLAKEAIYKACGEEPKGFRAPVFSIPERRKDIFKVIERHFDYDSSYVIDLSKRNFDDYKNEPPFNLTKLKEFPIVPKKIPLINFSVKSGGTFLRLFTKRNILRVMEFNYQLGFIPMVYLHPYDYLVNREFWVPFKNFKSVGTLPAYIKYFRQSQWLMLGNKKVFSKLDYLLKHFDHQGRMDSLLSS